MATIHRLFPDPPKIAPFLRVGTNDHRRFEDLISSGRMPAERFVFEAANVSKQSALIQTIKSEDRELVLDPSVAELSSVGRFSSAVRHAPWAKEGAPLEASDFERGSNINVAQRIAEFGIKHQFDTILSPSHLLDQDISWAQQDFQSCVDLRRELDVHGATDIAIDYQLIISYARLREPNFIHQLIDQLQGLPFQYLWVRISGFGMDATPTSVAKVTQALFQLQRLGRPVICDYLAGLTSLALTAFGAASGFAHGVAKKERFNTSTWNVTKESSGGWGQEKSIYFDVLDRRLSVSASRDLFKKSPGARRELCCRNERCCPTHEATILHPESHEINQKMGAVAFLSNIPPEMRADRFLTDYYEKLRFKATRATQIKKVDDSLRAIIERASIRMDRTYNVLERVMEDVAPVPLASTPYAKEAVLRVRRNGEGKQGSFDV